MEVVARRGSHRDRGAIPPRRSLARVVVPVSGGRDHHHPCVHGVSYGRVSERAGRPSHCKIRDARAPQEGTVSDDMLEAGDYPCPAAATIVVEDLDGAEGVAGGDAIVDATGGAGDVGAALDMNDKVSAAARRRVEKAVR